MRPATLVVALLLVLSGCNALGASGETPSPATPAPVPTAAETATGTPRAGECVAPPPATPDRTPTDPARTDPLPRIGGDGPVDGAALVARHDRALRNHSYHLEAGHVMDVRALPDARAFSYEGIATGIYLVSAYAVGGRLYLTVRAPNGTRFVHSRPYRGAVEGGRFVPPLTGRSYLEPTVGRFNYTVVDRRHWNGTEVRVLRETVETPAVVGASQVLELNSTVYVDRRGIVRRVEHRELYDPIFEVGNETDLRTASFRVTRLDDTRIPRPDAFCGLGDAKEGLPAPPPTLANATDRADGTTGTRTGRTADGT